MSDEREHTAISSIHVRDQRRPEWLEVGNHLRVGLHVVKLCKAQICLAQS